MAQLTIANAHIQMINLLLSDGNLDEYKKYNLTPEMFGDFASLMERILQFEEEYKEMPVVDTVIDWDEDFYICEEVQDPQLLARQLQIDYFYTHEFNNMLNKTISNAQLEPEEAMQKMAEFCRSHTEIIYGKVKSYKYQEQAEEQIEVLEDMVTRRDVIIPTGFDSIDKGIGGLRTLKELCVVFARLNQGKSWVACKMAVEALKRGNRVLYYSGESPVEHVNYRLDTLLFGYPNNKLMVYDLTEANLKDYKSLRLANKNKYNGEIEIVTPEDHLSNKKLTVGELRGILQRGQYDYVIIDQLSEMEEDGKLSQNTKLKYKKITDQLAHLSSEFRTPIVLMCQANRYAGDTGTEENENECPELKDIADSDDIARVCTTAISICQPKQGELKLEVKKARFMGKNTSARYSWNVNIGEFEELTSGKADNLKPKRPQRPQSTNSEDVF